VIRVEALDRVREHTRELPRNHDGPHEGTSVRRGSVCTLSHKTAVWRVVACWHRQKIIVGRAQEAVWYSPGDRSCASVSPPTWSTMFASGREQGVA
jgi:hypothetical protein